MPGDWLWDGSGEPDPDDARLEALLRKHRYDRPSPVVPARPAWRGLPVLGAGTLLAAAAAFVLAARVEAPETWSCGEGCELAEGAWLETGDRAVTLEVADIGTMDVLPGSRLRLAETSEEQHRLELAIGSVHAKVYAPPRLLVVDTPHAAAVDLGCEYDLTVFDDGSSVLSVHTGLVELAHPERIAVVPAGAACMTFEGHGPGIPWWVEDGDQAFAEALISCDRGDTARLPEVLAASDPRDTLSLWHLLQRVPEAERDPVLDRIAALAPEAMAHSDRRRLRRLDRPALDRLFDELSSDWWR